MTGIRKGDLAESKQRNQSSGAVYRNGMKGRMKITGEDALGDSGIKPAGRR